MMFKVFPINFPKNTLLSSGDMLFRWLNDLQAYVLSFYRGKLSYYATR